jgi:hypothetical protein
MIFKNNKPVEIEEQVVESFVYTEEQLMARLKFFIGICLSLTLFGIVFVVLYSLIFVTQPLNAISPIDQKFFELIVPIATFLTGTLSGIMLAGGDKDAQEQALQAANAGWSKPPSPTPSNTTFTPPSNFGSVPLSTGTPQFTSSFGGNTNQFTGTPTTAPVPAFTPGVVMSSSGKPMPIQPPQPEL